MTLCCCNRGSCTRAGFTWRVPSLLVGVETGVQYAIEYASHQQVAPSPQSLACEVFVLAPRTYPRSTECDTDRPCADVGPSCIPAAITARAQAKTCEPNGTHEPSCTGHGELHARSPVHPTPGANGLAAASRIATARVVAYRPIPPAGAHHAPTMPRRPAVLAASDPAPLLLLYRHS